MESRTRVLVVYAVYEKSQEYKNNILYFIKHGIGGGWPNTQYEIEYIVVVNGGVCQQVRSALNDASSEKCPCKVTVLYRANDGFDFGAFDHGITSINGQLDDYSYIMFLNSSVRGPFLPMYTLGKLHWIDPFIQALKQSDDSVLVGTTINVLSNKHTAESLAFRDFNQILHAKCPSTYPLVPSNKPFAHVQSMVFLMNTDCIKSLIEHNVLMVDKARQQHKNDTFLSTIAQRELYMSYIVLYVMKKNITCILPEYHGIDYRVQIKDPNPTSVNGDPCFPGACTYRTIHPYEVVFIKTNRGLVSEQQLLSMTVTSSACNLRINKTSV